jgi:hypothetical protein
MIGGCWSKRQRAHTRARPSLSRVRRPRTRLPKLRRRPPHGSPQQQQQSPPVTTAITSSSISPTAVRLLRLVLGGARTASPR